MAVVTIRQRLRGPFLQVQPEGDAWAVFGVWQARGLHDRLYHGMTRSEAIACAQHLSDSEAYGERLLVRVVGKPRHG